MGVITGLAGVQTELDKRPKNEDFDDDKPQAKWVSLKDGETVKLIFLQEVDEGSPNYSEKNGLAIFSLQHSNPDNWQKKAACTADEGDCYGCANDWRQKIVFYANVLVDDGKNEPYVAIFSRALGKGSVAQTLLDAAADDDFNNSISDKTYKFSRKGKTKDDTTYTLSALQNPHKEDVESFELFELPRYVFTVRPEYQEKFYTGQSGGSDASTSPVPASKTQVDQKW